MSMDPFTANLLLETLSKAHNSGDEQGWNDIIDLTKEIRGEEKEIPEGFEEEVLSHLNEPCYIKGTLKEGVVVGFNSATEGFYPGWRYPYIVELSTGDRYEYEKDQVEFKKE